MSLKEFSIKGFGKILSIESHLGLAIHLLDNNTVYCISILRLYSYKSFN